MGADGGPVAGARHADLVVVPCRQSLFDLAAIRASLDVAALAGTPAVAVLNAVPTRAAHWESEARDLLARQGVEMLPAAIRNRVVLRALHPRRPGRGRVRCVRRGRLRDPRRGRRAARLAGRRADGGRMSKAGKNAGGALIEHIEDWRARNPAAAAGASFLDPSTARQRSTWPIGLDQIAIGPRLREVDEAVVERLAESMDRIGLQNPIQVRHNFGIDPGTGEYDRSLDGGGFALVAGAHRVEAARRLGWGRIEAFVLDDPSPDELALVEVDENLVRAELTPLDRGRFVAKREELHLKLHPEARHGGDRKGLEYRENIKFRSLELDPAPTRGFLEDTAETTGLAKSTVSRAVRIGKRILARTAGRT